MVTTNGDANTSNHSASPAIQMGLASYQECLSFGNGFQTKLLMIGGIILAIVAGALGPMMIWYFAQSFEDLSADPTTDEYLENITELAYAFLVLGSLAFCSLSLYSTLLQTAAGQMTIDLKTKWYRALLRQDLAYFDIQDVSGTATTISTNAAKFQRGVGNKLGLFVQFVSTFLGGMIYAFYSSWQTSFVVLLTVPFMAISGWFLVKMTTSQSQRKNASYAQAGAIVYTTVTSIRTILSLNGAQTMIDKFQAGTTQAYNQAVSQVLWLGLANGSIMSAFLLSSIVVPLFGGYMLYDQVRNEGCDPSGAVPGVPTCDPSGVDIFGAMFGIFFAASVLPQISTTIEAITEARAACFLALQVMNRIVKEREDDSNAAVPTMEENAVKSSPVRRQVGQTNTNNLPKYEIDSSSPGGKKPHKVKGKIKFRHVTFSYPTRMETNVFQDFSLKIKAGTTVALVGSSGSGKSTVAQLIERFYDPSSGSITLDGHNLKHLNVAWLRQNIGLVSQEPALFAATIRENIGYGFPGGGATMEQIEEAAKVANAHDFILDFPDGYETQVGDKGAKLSGGQKQRIAIARTIIKNPKVLVLDEATSALDSESEQIVQMAIDKLLESKKRTTIVIAHRLSTIRNADVIVVLENGQLVEMGSHHKLIKKKGKYYALVQAQKHPEKNSESEDPSGLSSKLASGWSSRTSSSAPETESNNENGDGQAPVLRFRNVNFAYPTRPDSKILSDFNLSVRSGETLALVGPSGHGKSTVVQLIERFYDPIEGSVELGGVDLRSCSAHWLRDQIGLVSQEPTLFDQTIAENIRFGRPDVTDQQVEQAAKDANAHDFIMQFPDGYNTQVGEGGTQVSGGQKQRICISRVLLRKPRLLLLDEATSALDSASERAVQEALDKIMAMDHQSTIVIAHRLSTIRNADRIAVIEEGKIKELGTYDELMSKEHGHFRRLQAFQNLDGFNPLEQPKESEDKEEGGEVGTKLVIMKEKIEKLKTERRAKREKQEMEEEELRAIDKEREKRNASRARQLAKGDEKLFLIGSLGALLTGAVFPTWGFLFAYMIELLFTPVLPCDLVGADTPTECQEYHDSVANDMNDLAKDIAWASVGAIVACMLGYTILFYGFGTATERMNKRVRDQTYSSLIRQEVGYFDAMPAGKLTSQLQDDAAVIHSFSGEPIRTLVINLSSVVVGIIIGFVFMWPFALLFLGILPFLGFGAEMEMKMYVTGEDEGDDGELLEHEHSPGGIVIESLLNIRTVASLTLEETKLLEFRKSLDAENPRPVLNNFLKGSGFGLGQFFQFWGIALMIWFGAWLLNTQPEKYSFRDFTICMFGLFFSLYGLTVALEGATDRNKAKLASDRIFGLIDRKSAIDPLAEEGTPVKKAVEASYDTSEEEEVEN